MPSNKEISRAFALYAELLLLHEQDGRLADFLAGASYRSRRMDDAIMKISAAGLKDAFRPEIVTLIEELKTTGTIQALDELVQLTPPGLFDMMRVKGLGGKKLAALWRKAKIDNIEDLLAACKAHELSKLPGFGTKTEQNIIAAIETLNKSAEHFHYANVADMADALVRQLQAIFPRHRISLCGEVRRQATTVSEIDVITTVPATRLTATAVRKVMTIGSSVAHTTTGHTLDELPVTIHHVAARDYFLRLFELTGSEDHVAKVLPLLSKSIKHASEEAIYKSAGLPYIVPELREDIAEWEYAKRQGELITDGHIKGVVHNHTTWSDGVDKLEPFIKACIKRGYEYAVISDHSQNAHYAGGLKPDKVLRQMEEIDALNEQVAPFRIFKSIECDILVSGDLDYTPELLQQFDMVIISVHQLLKMTEEKATARLIKAIENPYTTILGHMTGRQLLIRPGYPVNFTKVIDACAVNGVVIEINANPYRLDMDWSHIPYAMERGVMISINPDAHSIHEIDNIRWGVSAARKGGLTKDMTWNAMPLAKVNSWLKRKR